MQISESPTEIAQLLTQSGLEVVGITNFEFTKDNLAGLLIGQVMACEKHPNADRLKVTLVAIGNATTLYIVCGAPNVKVGQKVIVAPVGTQLYNQEGTALKIKKAKIKGVWSEGMICAEEEIGLGSAKDSIMVIDTPLPPGTPAAQYFDLQSDKIFEIDLTPNRGDACSHIGVARELGVLLCRSIQYPPVDKFKVEVQNLPIRVAVRDHNACPRYSGVAVSGVKVKESPVWLKEKLKAVGISPLNNIVDTTNFVLHELGQPLHAFDYDQIVGKELVVRQVEKGTPFVSLDNVARILNGEELTICDQEGVLCLAGILGGKRGSIHPNTQNIFLESAYFAPKVTRKAAKYHAIKTDASFRCERGTDPNSTVYALKRACLLIQGIAGGTIASAVIDDYPKEIVPSRVKIHYKNIAQLIGFSIPQATIRQILSGLDIAISQEEEDSFLVLIPPYRVNLNREVDVIEEIVRIYGYDRIEVTGKLGSTHMAEPTQPRQEKVQHRIATLLADNGYHEICTNSLTQSSYVRLTEVLHEQHKVAVLNPLSEALDVLRQTLLFSGLEVVVHNLNRKQTDLKLFEFGKTYHRVDELYVEKNRLGIWLTGNIEAANWVRKLRKLTFQDMNAIIYKVLYKLGITDFTCESSPNALYKEGVQIMLNKEILLIAGELHHSLLEQLAIKQAVFFTDIDWDMLLKKMKPKSSYQEISKFPSVKRDVSLLLDQSVTFEAVKRVITQQNEKLIRDVSVFDVYKGENLDQGKKAYALNFILQGKDKTLDDKTISQVMARLERAFVSQLGAVIRE